MPKDSSRPLIPLWKPGFRFPNGHVIGPSGIPRPSKFERRHKKAAARTGNLALRAAHSSGRK